MQTDASLGCPDLIELEKPHAPSVEAAERHPERSEGSRRDSAPVPPLEADAP